MRRVRNDTLIGPMYEYDDDDYDNSTNGTQNWNHSHMAIQCHTSGPDNNSPPHAAYPHSTPTTSSATSPHRAQNGLTNPMWPTHAS